MASSTPTTTEIKHPPTDKTPLRGALRMWCLLAPMPARVMCVLRTHASGPASLVFTRGNLEVTVTSTKTLRPKGYVGVVTLMSGQIKTMATSGGLLGALSGGWTYPHCGTAR